MERVLASGNEVYAGGSFRSVGSYPQSFLTGFSTIVVGGPVGPGERIALLRPAAPNPFRARTVLRFALPKAENVTLKVYDVAGREVAALLDRAPLGPGSHEVVFRADGLASGLYFCRIEAGDLRDSRSIALMH